VVTVMVALNVLVAVPARAAADPAPPVANDGRRAEAAERFDRGMALLEEGDNSGALAELVRVYELAPHPQVLFNLGLVYAALNRPVEATRAFEQVLGAPGSLPAESLELARRTREDQARRVALLEITTSVPATIEVDGIEVGKTPLEGPLAMAAGTRVVAALSPGYLPVRREITVAGQTTHKMQLDLSPSELRLAHLLVRTALPAADVLVDGERVGRTPLPSSIAVAPGRRVVEIRRAGYRPAQRVIVLDDGATGELAFDPEEEPGGGHDGRRGRLVLAVSEPDSDVTVDGQPRGAYRGPLSLPAGQHQVRTVRAGFLPAERMVMVPEGGEVVARITLVPTPETRAAYKQRASLQQSWGWAGAIGGAALAVGAGVLVALNQTPLDDAEANRRRILDEPLCKMAKENGTLAEEMCDAVLAPADDQYDKHKNRQTVGLIALAAGVVAAGVGTVLLLTGDDPERYDRTPRELASAGGRGLGLGGWFSPGGDGGGFALGGRF
jgi:hypothetical protein